MGRFAAALASALLLPALPATAQPMLLIDGGGNGHGVGMSQWGAYGLARHGFDYRSILAHYYPGTRLGQSTQPTVTVLLQSSRPSVIFSGATRLGARRLDPATEYRAAPDGAGLRVSDPQGHTLARAADRMVIAAGGPFVLRGIALNGRRDGRYRGVLELRRDRPGVSAYDSVSIDDYVRGVVAAESDSSWPLAELEAQAVASRTFAITAGRLYADTRSQQYNGIAAETKRTDAAVAATAGQIVTYAGKPAITYFFDASGGETENVENGFPGSTPKPWLVAVPDPYDAPAPLHRWGPYRLALSTAQARLAGLVSGTLRSIDVVRRGVSPRVLAADIVGSAGRRRVSGAQLASRLRLRSTWACFTITGPTGLAVPGWDTACRLGLGPGPVPGGELGGAVAP